MASIQEPEVQLAQRLASNEKPLRTKALKKLRKYINVRSHIGTGLAVSSVSVENPTPAKVGIFNVHIRDVDNVEHLKAEGNGRFTGDELLKLWKGLFYCLWMQDKPLLQEELSNQISTLIHSFHEIDGQMLYLESFLQTLKREWTGIDRLRMDKFFQLVRFMFRQTFEMLKRKNWDSWFLELLTAQLLQRSSGTPNGLQFHVLDLYLTELAAVGSAELTADQNLIFIEPFCKTAAKTKDRSLFTAICNSILNTIIEQAPFAIEDLMKEVKAAEDSDSGQSSEEDPVKKKRSNLPSKKGTWKQINGNKSNEEEGDGNHDDDYAERLHLEDSDTEMSCDDDIGPVLQFDYAALADKLFELASQSSTPSQNRQRLYKIIKVLRDLSEGLFPQSEYPEEVSTDEDDEMFGSRKRIKRGKDHMEEDEEGVSAAKKSKGKKKEASTLHKQSKDSGTDEPADLTANNEKKKKKKKKKAGQCKRAVGEAVTQAHITMKETEGGLGCSRSEKEAKTQSSISPLNATEAATREGQSETLVLSQVTVTEETSQQTPCMTDNKEHSELKPEVTEALEEQPTPVETEREMSPEADATVSGKKRKKGLKAKLQSNEIVIKMQVNAEAEIIPVSSEGDATTPTKKKKKVLKAKENLEEVEDETPVNGMSTKEDFPSMCCEEDGPITSLEKPTHSKTICSKKRWKKNLKADKAPKPEADAQCEAEGKHTKVPSFGEEASQYVATVPSKKKTKKIDTLEDATLKASPAVDKSTVTPLKQNEYSETIMEEDRAATENSQTVDAEKVLFEVSMKKTAKNRKNLAASQIDKKGQTQLQVIGTVNAELFDGAEVVHSSGKPGKKKRRKIPVVFEYEADELEAAAQKATLNSGLAEGETLTKKSAKSESKSQTPKSESKKVTFGLKNNKTAEFRKADRSLLVSPDGSSRVPFDPKQKPKFGVLKTPPITRSARKTNRKTSLETPKSTPKRQPSAADFF